MTFTPTIGNSRLTVSTNSNADVGSYLVKIAATLTPKPSGSPFTMFFDFTLNIINRDDCLNTSLTIKTISAMTNQVAATGITQDVWIADSISTSHSNLGFCGGRTYTLSPSLSFLTLSGSTLTLFTNITGDVSSNIVTMTVSLTDYPLILSKTF